MPERGARRLSELEIVGNAGKNGEDAYLINCDLYPCIDASPAVSVEEVRISTVIDIVNGEIPTMTPTVCLFWFWSERGRKIEAVVWKYPVSVDIAIKLEELVLEIGVGSWECYSIS